MKGLELIKNRNLLKNSGYINGYFTNGTAISKFPVINPSNGSIITELPSMTAVDASVACDSAYDAWKQWRYLPAKNRGIHLKKMADLMKTYQNDIAAIMTLECGKPFNEAKGELNYATSFYDYCAEECKRIKGETLESPTRGNRIVTIKQSVGPAALITPWNFPAAMITRKVGPALAAGCSVVIKPAAETPLTALALCAIAEEAGIPPGVVNCLTVENTHVTDVGKTLCHSEKIRKLSFTGSTNVGKWLMRESSHNVKKVQL